MAKTNPKQITVLCKNSHCEGHPPADNGQHSRATMNFINSYFGNFAAYQCPMCETQRFLLFTRKKHEDVTEESIPWMQWGVGMFSCGIALFGISIILRNIELVVVFHILLWTGIMVYGIGHEKNSKKPMPLSAILGLWFMIMGILCFINTPTVAAEIIASQDGTPTRIPEWWKWMDKEDRHVIAGIGPIILGAILWTVAGVTYDKKILAKK